MLKLTVLTGRHSSAFTPLFLLTFFFLLLYFPLGCGVGAGAPASSSLEKEQTAVSTGQLPPQFFGMVVKQAGVKPAVQTGARRLWDSGVNWAALEPTPGTFVWTLLDAEVAQAQADGVELTLTLGMTPAWASSQPEAPSSYGTGATAMPARLADWDMYVAAVASRYQGRIHAYEVWNAPENAAYFSDSPGQMGNDMAALAEHAAAAVHSADPTAVVVSPAFSPRGLSAFLVAGGGASVDVIGCSLNGGGTGGSTAPESMATTLPALRAALAGTAADGKPLWNEQASWVLGPGETDAGTQASYTARALLLNAGLGVARLQWYAWDESDPGALLLENAQGQPTAAAVAYNTVEGWLAGSQLNGCAATANSLWTCQLVRGGSPAWVVWSSAGAISASALGASTVTDVNGNVSAVATTGLVSVGPSPLLLE